VFSIYQIEAPIGWLGSDNVICVYYRSMSVPQLYKLQSYKLRIIAVEAREQASKEIATGSS
jgi:hypothetical protein